jgi:hypothetical protein
MRDVRPSLHHTTRGGRVGRGTCFGILGTNWVTRADAHIEFQEDLDHLIAGCVTTAAKFPPFQPTQRRPLTHSRVVVSVRMATFTQPGGVGGCRGDALAEMPSVKPRAQLAFKDSMIRGILQFTLRIAFRCVLHRCKSQDIRC